MLNSSSGAFLMELLDEKNITAEERQRIIVISTALSMINIAVNTEESNHRLADEMQNLEKYVGQIEALLK